MPDLAELDGVEQEFPATVRPLVAFVFFDQIVQVPGQVGQTDLVVPRDGARLRPPPVAHQGSPGEPLREMVVDGRLSPGLRVCDVGKQGVLPGPEPVLVPVHLDAGLVGAYYRGDGDPLPYRFVERCGPVGETGQQVMYAALADVDVEHVAHHFPHSFEGKVLPCVEIADKPLDVAPVAYRGTRFFGEVGDRGASAPA